MLSQGEARLGLASNDAGEAFDVQELHWSIKEERISRVALEHQLAEMKNVEHQQQLELRSERERYDELCEFVVPRGLART